MRLNERTSTETFMPGMHTRGNDAVRFSQSGTVSPALFIQFGGMKLNIYCVQKKKKIMDINQHTSALYREQLPVNE